jgi:hypothetical protein
MRRKLGSRLRRGLALAALAAAAALGGAIYALAGHDATTSITGCLNTSTGTLSRFAVGEAPKSSCPGGHLAVHLSGGDITAVSAGSGLTGGGTAGAVTLAVDPGSLTGVNADTLDGQDSTDFLGATAAAGGDLTGNYPNPAIAPGAVGTAEHSTTIPAVGVTHSAAQSTAGDGSTTVLAFDSERYDTASMHDTSTDTSRLVAPVTGIYAITVSVAWAADASGRRTVHLRRNGGASIAVAQSAAAGGDEVGMALATLARLEAGDYVEVLAQQTSGSNLNIQKGGEHSPEFAMTWLAAGP